MTHSATRQGTVRSSNGKMSISLDDGSVLDRFPLNGDAHGGIDNAGVRFSSITRFDLDEFREAFPEDTLGNGPGETDEFDILAIGFWYQNDPVYGSGYQAGEPDFREQVREERAGHETLAPTH